MSASRMLLARVSFSLVGVSAGCMLFNPLDPAESDVHVAGGRSAAGGTVAQAAGAGGDDGGAPTIPSSGGASSSFGGKASVGVGGSGGVRAADAGSAGEGGSRTDPPPIVCSANADCYTATGAPAFCRLPEQRCVDLTSSSCRISGDPTNPRALIFGAFAPFSDSVEAHTVRDTYDLAFNEFMQSQGLAGPGGRHPLVMVLCDSDGGASVIDAGVRHLISDVRVPAILAALSSADLQRNFESDYGGKTFYLSPQTVSEELANSDVDGLVWNLLGRNSDLQGIYARVAAQLEVYLRKLDPSIVDLRVAVVTELANSEANALSLSVLPALHFNTGNASFTDNVSQGNAVLADVSDPQAVPRVLALKPHLVISLARGSFTELQGVAAQLEQRLLDRPFYLLSPWNSAAEDDLRTLFDKENSAGIPNAQRRFLGIDAASALDANSRDVKNEYVSRLISLHSADRTDFENYYDAFYYLVYAMYGGGFPITSFGTASGMQRLYQGSEVRYIGPVDIYSNLTWLQGRDPMYLMGALGPPTFDVSGGRIDHGSVYCFDDSQPPKLMSNVLAYDPATDKLSGTTPSLQCLRNFL